jgi:hypothetical protein
METPALMSSVAWAWRSLVDVDLDAGLLAVVGVSVRLVQPGTSV